MWRGLASGVLAALAASAVDDALRAAEATPAAQTAPDAAREEFLAAMQRVRLRTPEPPDSPSLSGYVLYDYLVAARLRRDLELKAGPELDTTIDAFETAHVREPVARALRHDWLTSLAQRHRWDWFLPRAADVSDPALICSRLQGRLETGDTERLGADVLARWNLPQRQPHECDTVFQWLHQQGLATVGLAQVRTRAALAADSPRLAREFAAELPPDVAAPLLQWAQLLETPRPALNTLAANPARPVESDALEAGFNRLARNDAAAAIALLPRLLARPDMTPMLHARLLRDAALGAAYERSPAAIDALAQVPAEALDDETQQWRVRVALWSGDFTRALPWIEQLSPSLAAQPRWRYWRARAVAKTQGAAAAAPLFAEIAGLRDYYGYLAADRLHRSYVLNAQPSPDVPPEQADLAAQPGLVRAHALFDCDMIDEAATEWAAALVDADPSVKVQAAHLAAHWGWYSQSIATLAQAGEWDDVRLRYPRPYATAIEQASNLTQLPADWILAVIRQESLFRHDAISRAEARGLMQLRLSTAVALARRWHLPTPTADGLFDPDMGVMLGAAYLREMLDRYGGQLAPGLAAYNAGPAAVARWLPHQPMDADVWIENIGFGETRDYLQRILEHIVAYGWVRSSEPPRLIALLPPVMPASPLARNPPVGARSVAVTTAISGN